MTMIPLNNKGGLEPHLCVCPLCGGETNELTVGVLKKAQDSKGVWHYINRGGSSRFNNQRRQQGLETLSGWEPVPENERVPGNPCDDCVSEQENFKDIVADGGIFFKCKECHKTGVIKKSEFAQEIRDHLKVSAPDPCGFEFSKCEEHEDED